MSNSWHLIEKTADRLALGSGSGPLLFILAFIAGLSIPGHTEGQNTVQELRPGASVLVTPRGRYDAGPLKRMLMGSGYREFWALPVEAVVLDLDEFAGGLTVVRRGGGMQTASLRLRGADGLLYNFRSIDKDATQRLDSLISRTFVGWAIQDQIGAILPMGALVVSPLAEAAGVLHTDPALVIVPDDPRLGEFREEFAGLLGYIELRPDEGPDGEPGFAGSTRVISSPRFFELLEEDAENRIDAPAFLRARLVDIYVGDWDRHPDQWRWAGFDRDGVEYFEPVPRDRDWALSKLNGLMWWVYRINLHQYVGFGREYPDAFNSTWSGRALDRRLLTEMEWPEWEAVASDVQSRLTDAVIEDAVGRLPDSYYQKIGAELTEAFKLRRDALVDAARDFYELLAGDVDVHATDQEDLAVVEGLDDERFRVELFEMEEDGSPRGEAYFSRTFNRSETNEVRVFLHGDDDRFVIRESAQGLVKVRVIGGGGDDTLIDETSGGQVLFYDARGDNEFVEGPRTKVDESEYERPDVVVSYGAEYRDWGARWLTLPALESGADRGSFVGVSATRTGYGFREYPYGTLFRLSGGIGTGTRRPALSASVDLPAGPFRWISTAQFDGSGRSRWFGFGNETAEGADVDSTFYEVDRKLLGFSTSLMLPLTERISVTGGAVMEYFKHDDNVSTLILAENPYGYGDFFQAGLQGGINWDSRDNPAYPQSGVLLSVNGRLFPKIGDVTELYGRVAGSLAAYVTARGPLEPTLALRVGGERAWGDLPYQSAAYIGGDTGVRGFLSHRYAGESSAFGNVEVRLPLREMRFFPGEMGLFGLADVGRVWYDGESSDKWHHAFGGGIWIGFLLERNPTLTLGVANSEEGTLPYFRAGFAF